MMLTDTELRRLTIPDAEQRLKDGDGLRLVVKPSGKKIWQYRYRFAQKENTLTLGRYPETGLAEARRKRDAAKQVLSEGRDPSAVRAAQQKAVAVAAEHTFAHATTEWLKVHKLKVEVDTYEKTVGQINEYLLPELGAQPIATLTTRDALRVLRSIQDGGHIETMHRCKSYLSRIFQYAGAEDWVRSDITWAIKGESLQPVQPINHPGFTDPKAIGHLLRTIDGFPFHSPIPRLATQLSAHFALRPRELRKGVWAEVDLAAAEWHIPAERMKMRQPHIVPLSRQALALLRELQAVTGDQRLMFPISFDPNRSMSENTINKNLRAMGFCTRTQHCAHGFRTTFSTRLNEEGMKLHATKDWIEMQLAHVEGNRVRAAYNKARYLDDRKIMMQCWSDYLDRLKGVSEHPAAQSE